MLALALLLGPAAGIRAQAIDLACQQYLKAPYISDGQRYSAELQPQGLKTFAMTFFGSTTYRVVVCGDNDARTRLVFKLFDQERNLLFDNSRHDYTPYWDFEFLHTLECTLEVSLAGSAPKACTVLMLVGFANHP